MSRYTAGAEVLRLLASSEPVVLNGEAEPLRSILRLGANACEQLDEADQQRTRALLRVAELELLLTRVADALESAPIPMEGGSWAMFELAAEIRRALGTARPDP